MPIKSINIDKFMQSKKEIRKKVKRINILPTKNDLLAAQVVNKIAFCDLTLGVFISDEVMSCRDVNGYWFRRFVDKNINDLVGVYDKDIMIDDIVGDLKAFQHDKKINRIIKSDKKRK